MKYKASFTVDLGELVPEAGKLLKTLNESLASFGMQERLCARSDWFSVTITSDRELTADEQSRLGTMIETFVVGRLEQFNVRMDSFRQVSA